MSNDGGNIGVGSPAAIQDRPSVIPGVEPANSAANPSLDSLENALAAVQQAAGVPAAASAEAPVKTQEEAFRDQFVPDGLTKQPVTPPSVTEIPVVPSNPGTKTADDLLKEIPQVGVGDNSIPAAEAASQPEQTPKDEFIKKVSDAFDEALEQAKKPAV